MTDLFDKKIQIRVRKQADKRLMQMARQEVAKERGCDPEEIGQIELFRALALYRINNPRGVKIMLNGESDTLIRAIEESDTSDFASALDEIAEDSLRLKERQKATEGGAKYTGGTDA